MESEARTCFRNNSCALKCVTEIVCLVTAAFVFQGLDYLEAATNRKLA